MRRWARAALAGAAGLAILGTVGCTGGSSELDTPEGRALLSIRDSIQSFLASRPRLAIDQRLSDDERTYVVQQFVLQRIDHDLRKTADGSRIGHIRAVTKRRDNSRCGNVKLRSMAVGYDTLDNALRSAGRESCLTWMDMLDWSPEEVMIFVYVHQNGEWVFADVLKKNPAKRHPDNEKLRQVLRAQHGDADWVPTGWIHLALTQRRGSNRPEPGVVSFNRPWYELFGRLAD